jgi:hypothetical protein
LIGWFSRFATHLRAIGTKKESRRCHYDPRRGFEVVDRSVALPRE